MRRREVREMFEKGLEKALHEHEKMASIKTEERDKDEEN